MAGKKYGVRRENVNPEILEKYSGIWQFGKPPDKKPPIKCEILKPWEGYWEGKMARRALFPDKHSRWENIPESQNTIEEIKPDVNVGERPDDRTPERPQYDNRGNNQLDEKFEQKIARLVEKYGKK